MLVVMLNSKKLKISRSLLMLKVRFSLSMSQCLSLNVSVPLSMSQCVSLNVSVCLSQCLSVSLSMSQCLSVSLSQCLSTFPFLSVSLPLSLSVSLPLSLSVSLPLYLIHKPIKQIWNASLSVYKHIHSVRIPRHRHLTHTHQLLTVNYTLSKIVLDSVWRTMVQLWITFELWRDNVKFSLVVKWCGGAVILRWCGGVLAQCSSLVHITCSVSIKTMLSTLIGLVQIR